MPNDITDPDIIRVQHMLLAIQEIEEFLKDRLKDDFAANRMLVLATIKEIEIIGEAASKVSTRLRDSAPEIPWRIMSDTRNRLARGYNDINLDILWKTLTESIPELKPKLVKLIDKQFTPHGSALK